MWRNGKRSVFLILLCFIGVGCLTFILGESYPASLADGVMKLVSKGDKEEATDMNIDTTPSPDPTATPTISPTPTPLPVYEMKREEMRTLSLSFKIIILPSPIVIIVN